MSTEITPVTAIKIALINAPEWNSRLGIRDDKELAALAESMSVNGLQEPIKVEKVAGTDGYLLVFGSRRLAAAKKLGWKEIPGFVVDSTDPLNRTILNVTENFNRQDLTSFEVARACAHIREEIKASHSETTIEDIAKQLGMSRSRVSQLTQAYESLPRDIKEAWAKEGSAQDDGIKVLDATFINELVALRDPDKQLKAFKERTNALAAAFNNGGKKAAKKVKADEKRKKATNLTIPADRLKALKKALKADLFTKQAAAVLAYVFGDADSIPGVIDAPAEDDNE